MTYNKDVWIMCDADGCLADYAGGTTASEVREFASEDGWKTGQPGGKDYCPKHSDTST